MINEDPNQIRERTKSDVDFAVMMMMGTDIDPESTAEERDLQKDLLWVQASPDRTEFLTRGRQVKDKWEQVIQNDPEYSQGYLPTWQNPWMEFKLAFLSESDDPKDEKEFRSILRPDEKEDPIVTIEDIHKEESNMPSTNPKMTNEDVLQQSRSDWTEPYQWQHPSVIDHQDVERNLPGQIKDMMTQLGEYPESRYTGYDWTLKPLYEFSDINPDHRGNGLAESLKDLPQYLQPKGFERKDLPGNRYQATMEIDHEIVTQTYSYPLVSRYTIGSMDDVEFTRPSDTELAARVLQDYMIDKTLTAHQELMEDIATKDKLCEQFQANGWSDLTISHPEHPELTMTIEPHCYGDVPTKDTDIEYFSMSSPDVMLYGDEHLINVAHTYRHLPEEVEQQKESEDSLDKFFREHIEGYTHEQHSLISDIWDAEHRVERELGGMSNLSYEERQAKLAEIMPQETQLPKEVYLAAKELGENRSTYSDWHKDNYGHRPHGDDEWGIGYKEIHPFGGIPYSDYIDAFKNSPAMQKAKDEFFTEHIAGHTLEQYQLADAVKKQQKSYEALYGSYDSQGMESHITRRLEIPHIVYQEIKSFNSAREQYEEKFSVPAGPQNTPQSLQEWGVSPIEIKPFAGIPLKDNALAHQLEQAVGLDISDPLVYHTKQMFSEPKIPSLTELIQDAKANMPHPKHPSEIRTPSTDGFSRHMSEGWKPLKDATIEGDGYKVEFSRYADKTIDTMCDALNGWYYVWRNDFNCTYTDDKGKLELRLDKPEDADRLFDIMTNIQPVTFEHEGSMTTAEVARAGMEAIIQFIHPDQTKQTQHTPQAQASQPQSSEKSPDRPDPQQPLNTAEDCYNKIEGYTWEQWNYAHSVDQQTTEYLNAHPGLDSQKGADAAAPIIADKMHIPTVVVEAMQRFNEDVAAYKHIFKQTFGREPDQHSGEIGPTTSEETKPFADILVTEYETMWMKEKNPTYVPPQIENRYLDASVSTENLSPGYYHTEVNHMGMPTVYGKAKINDQEMDVYFEQRYKTHMLTDPEIHSLLLGQTISVPEGTESTDVKLTEHEQYKGLWMVMPAEPEKTAKTTQAQASEPQSSEKKDFSQLKPGEYEIVQNKQGVPYIHGKPDFKGAPSEVYFKQTYGPHELTDMETKSLLKGNEISVPVRSGNAKVKLGEGEVNGHKYFGLQKIDTPARSRRLPDAPETSTPTSDKQAGDD